MDITRESKVEAPPEIVWGLVRELVDAPLRFMPLATSATVKRRKDGGADSTIEVFGFTLKERVTLDETNRVAAYEMVDSPDWSGLREIRVLGGPKKDERAPVCRLSISFFWTPRSPKAEAVDVAGVERLVQEAADRLKEYAEAKKKA